MSLIKKIKTSIQNAAEKVKGINPIMLNERYFHHAFSQDWVKANTIQLHPEWPTHKKNILETGVLFTSENQDYRPANKKDNKSHTGWTDFALGKYKNPDAFVEFSTSWNKKYFKYYFMKLMHASLPLKSDGVAVLCVITHSTHREPEKYLSCAFEEAKKALGRCYAKTRNLCVWLVIICHNSNTKMELLIEKQR